MMDNLFNGKYDVVLFRNDHNDTVKYNYIRFDSALCTLLFWINTLDELCYWYPSMIPLGIFKNGKLIAKAATYSDYYKYVLPEFRKWENWMK